MAGASRTGLYKLRHAMDDGKRKKKKKSPPAATPGVSPTTPIGGGGGPPLPGGTATAVQNLQLQVFRPKVEQGAGAAASAAAPGEPPRTPLLMLPERGEARRTFYNLTSGKGLDVDLPEMSHGFCHMALHGWVMVSNCLSLECFLLEPVSRARSDLPSLALCARTPHAALSSAPTQPGCVVALAFHKTVILCRPGAPSWSVHRLEDYDHDSWFGDGAFCGGKLYLMCGEGRKLFVLDPAAGGCEEPGVQRVEMDAAQLPRAPEGCRRLGFLVESVGELLLVVAMDRLTWCGVFRADMERRAWAAVESLEGRRALLVGRGCSVSVGAEEARGGFRAGRVYLSYPQVLVNRENQHVAMLHGRWFWAEHLVGMDFPPMKRAPPIRHRDISWEASYWLIPTTVPSPPPPPGKAS